MKGFPLAYVLIHFGLIFTAALLLSGVVGGIMYLISLG